MESKEKKKLFAPLALSNVHVKSLEYLTYKEWNTLMTDEVKKLLSIEIICFDQDKKSEHYLDQTLADMDFVRETLVIDEIEYLVYHGFASDNPVGLLMDISGKDIITDFGGAYRNKYITTNDKYKDLAIAFMNYFF